MFLLGGRCERARGPIGGENLRLPQHQGVRGAAASLEMNVDGEAADVKPNVGDLTLLGVNSADEFVDLDTCNEGVDMAVAAEGMRPYVPEPVMAAWRRTPASDPLQSLHAAVSARKYWAGAESFCGAGLRYIALTMGLDRYLAGLGRDRAGTGRIRYLERRRLPSRDRSALTRSDGASPL